jgi:hypothetical protein
MNNDDPKLTAYALGELSREEEMQIEAKLAASPEDQRVMAETRALSQLLASEYKAELHRDGPRPVNLIDIRDDPWFWSKARPLAIAAALAICAFIALVAFPWIREKPQVSRAGLPPVDTQTEVIFQNTDGELPAGNGESDSAQSSGESPFLFVRDHPRSTFPLKLGQDSYSKVERFLKEGSLPPKNAVRIGEMINYFTYDYPGTQADEVFSVIGDAAGCPWDASHRLVRVGIKGREAATKGRRAIARDATVEVAFNPGRVTSYRLISYEKGSTGPKDSKRSDTNGDEILPGHTATALYEIVRAKEQSPRATTSPSASELLKVTLRYKRPDGAKIESTERAIADTETMFENASLDFKFIAAVAEFGMILRDSEYKGDATLAMVMEVAETGKGKDADGKRANFLELVRKAQALKKS